MKKVSELGKNKKTGKKLEINVLFEDENLIVINKPSGLTVHPDGKRVEYTLVDWLLEKYPKIKNVGEPLVIDYKNEKITIPRPGIVHRLDKETSGVMVVAKNDFSYGFLKKKFKEHKIKKTYRAFVYGHIKNDIGTIDAPIGRSSDDIRKWNAGRGARGEVREAKTFYRVIDRFTTDEIIEIKNKDIFKKNEEQGVGKVCYVECYPQTGRTHQIRVHTRFINHPIVSDSLYAENKPKMLGFKRVALHAYILELPLPDKDPEKHGKKILNISADLPNDFKKVVKKYNLGA